MHPAYSVILFTTASGAGYGLLAVLSLGGAYGIIQPEFWLGLVGFGLGLAFVTLGLLSSTFHLGHPERAWRAFSQWRSSWLSREGVAAVATYPVVGLVAISWVFWHSAMLVPCVLAAVLCTVTVYCTGMIYQSLPTIRQWQQPLTTPVYLALALASGAVLLTLLLALFGAPLAAAAGLAILALCAAALLKLAYWRRIDSEPKTFTAEDATGLGRFGKVRPLDPPHSQPNYVMREMGFSVARKHRDKLRRLVLALLFAVPVFALLLTFSGLSILAVLGALIATVSAAIGLATERWLFFAEAEHVAMLFYGRESA